LIAAVVFIVTLSGAVGYGVFEYHKIFEIIREAEQVAGRLLPFKNNFSLSSILPRRRVFIWLLGYLSNYLFNFSFLNVSFGDNH